MELIASLLLESFPNTFLLFEKLAPFLMVLIGFIVVLVVQSRQGRVQKNQLGMELFEKRYEFLQIIRNITSISLTNDVRYFERIQKDYGKFVQYRLLFPKSIARQVDKLLANCDELLISARNVDAYGQEETPRKIEEVQFAAIRQRIRTQMDALEKRIEDFIRIDWHG